VQIIAEDWKGPVTLGLEFDAASKALAWNAKDTKFTGAEVKELSPGMLQFSGVKLAPTVGDILILREADRPDPAVWVSESKSITVSNVTVHSGLGMGFIAQRSQDVHLDHFSVALADGSPRYITTNADGAHFSQCRGNITVENGLFENMLDDGINVHGVYLRVVKLTAPDTVLAEFGHSQAFGFSFADAGDHIQFDNPKTLLDYATGVVKSVNAPDPHHVQLVFQSAVPAQIKPGDALDDVDWWPTVIYRNNTVRHNRARGSVLKSPRSILVEGNTYDHLSGTAILLADDASNWYESTPASNMIIRNNTITDPMISSYGSAPIFTKFAIDPTQEGDRYNSHNILIEGNTFNLFQRSLLDMTSVDGLIFRNNTVKLNHDFKPNIAEDASPIMLNHVRCVMIGDNKLPWMMTPSDVSAEDAKLLSVGSGDGGSQKEWDSACTTSVTGAH